MASPPDWERLCLRVRCPRCNAQARFACRTAAIHPKPLKHPHRERVAAERALLRTLKDIDDGHLGLWLKLSHYHPESGKRLDPPVIAQITPDRQVEAAVPNRQGEWWNELVDRGWLQPPPPGAGERRYLTTDAGHHEVTEIWGGAEPSTTGKADQP
jgi:hypothetical protein